VTPAFTRHGCSVTVGHKLARVVGRKPAGATAGQWSAAGGAVVDFLVDGPDGRAGAVNDLGAQVRVEERRTACGIEPDRLAEDLAVAAVGERLKLRHTTAPALVARDTLDREYDRLRGRRAELVDPFALDAWDDQVHPAVR
jgi:hypothetical protein